MIALSYGGGTNSAAMLVGMNELGIRPDHITFADTGAEKPHTYKHIEIIDKWLIEIGFPSITVVNQLKRDGTLNQLEQLCLDNNMLPSIAYGYKSCSLKHKVAPQDKFFNNLDDAKEIWNTGESIIKYIGYDADEHHRVKFHKSEDGKYIYQYPLIEWNWGRDECINAIIRAGLPLPGKSACFFCPSSKKQEILQLKKDYPELAERAIIMEKNAHLTSVKGLGRNFAWSDLYLADENQGKLFCESNIEIDCGCYDG